MDGNALKTVKTRRYNKDEYLNLARNVIDALINIDDIARAEVIPAYREKETFGDLDVLYTTFSGNALPISSIQQAFSPKEYYKNGSVISFDKNEFQIDLIYSNSKFFDYALNYFSYNDQGNLVGKLAHKFGLKHGHTGLRLPIRNDDQVFDDILITSDYNNALKFLNLDADVFVGGFDNLNQLFTWVASSNFYNPDLYKLENLNHTAKVRDKNRATYAAFLEFGETYTGPVSNISWNKDKTEYIQTIFDAFPEAWPEYQASLRKLAAHRYVASKFNGDIVLRVAGVTGKPLGELMKILRKDWRFTKENIILCSPEKIEANILEVSKTVV